MIKQNDEITIRRVANGFIVTPPPDYSRGVAFEVASVLVFTELGYGSTNSDDPQAKSLLAWLMQHFSDK